MDRADSPRPVSRRTALTWAAGVGVGVPVLAACGGGDAGGGGMGYGAPDATGTPSRSPSSLATEETQGGGTAAGRELVRLADVPVGGAVVTEDAAGKPVVVGRPSEDEVVAFSAVCTHRGCTVAAEDRVLRCPCHGSTFDPTTGENTGGPAPRPLAEVAVRVEGESVVEG